MAKILGVTRKTVWQWHTTLYFDCPLFSADERAHDGRYLYEVERVMQLKAVYRPNWTRGSYEPAPADEKQPRITEAEKFFNLLFGNVQEKNFGYLWAKQKETPKRLTPSTCQRLTIATIWLSKLLNSPTWARTFTTELT